MGIFGFFVDGGIEKPVPNKIPFRHDSQTESERVTRTEKVFINETKNTILKI